MDNVPGLLLVERIGDCIRTLNEAGLNVATIPVHWLHGARLPDIQLTEREQRVLSCLARGYTYQAIADEMNIARKTVGSYIQRIREKTNTRTRKQLVELAQLYEISTARRSDSS